MCARVFDSGFSAILIRLFVTSNDDFRVFRLEKSLLTSAFVTGDITNLDEGLLLQSSPATQDSFSAFLILFFRLFYTFQPAPSYMKLNLLGAYKKKYSRFRLNSLFDSLLRERNGAQGCDMLYYCEGQPKQGK